MKNGITSGVVGYTYETEGVDYDLRCHYNATAWRAADRMGPEEPATCEVWKVEAVTATREAGEAEKGQRLVVKCTPMPNEAAAVEAAVMEEYEASEAFADELHELCFEDADNKTRRD